jgi:hypothetical protein
MRGSRNILCRLALDVVVGTLQSLLPATSNSIGACFLHHVYRHVHNETLESFDDIQHIYHSGLALGALAQADFSWWEQALTSWSYGDMEVEVEVEVVELLNGWNQGMDPSQIWKPVGGLEWNCS